MTTSFQELGLIPDLLETLATLNYAHPTSIQEQAIPPLLAGQDVLGQAQTGTGKTAAFTLPVLQQLSTDGLQMLVLAPTRELAIQVAEAVHRYGNKLGIRVLPIYGGQSYDRQERRLKKGVQVVVGTPGRTLDLIRKGTLNLADIRFVVLDEADEMLKMGFIEDIEAILGATNADTRQTILFSATFSPNIRKLAQKYMRDALHIHIEAEEVTATNIEQRYYMVQNRDKIAAISRILETEAPKNTLVFTRTKIGAAELAEKLTGRGYPAVAIHGDLSQQERERILQRFRDGYSDILVATDVMARGVDIPYMSHVINYDIPQLAIEYVHRIGRTGRAGRSGEAITLITPREKRLLKVIEQYIGRTIDKAKLPSREAVLERRQQQFKEAIIAQMEAFDGDTQDDLLAELFDLGYDPVQIAAALVEQLRSEQVQRPLEEIRSVQEKRERRSRRDRNRDRRTDEAGDGRKSRRKRKYDDTNMVRLVMQVGRSNGIKPGDVVYQIASKSNIPGSVIGAIDIHENATYLDIPKTHVDSVLNKMKKGKFRGQLLKLEMAK